MFKSENSKSGYHLAHLGASLFVFGNLSFRGCLYSLRLDVWVFWRMLPENFLIQLKCKSTTFTKLSL